MNDNQTPDHESETKAERKQPSDARIILGPLVKHAAIGLVLVSIIVTTAVMLDRQFNKIDEEVAALQAELAKAHEPTETDIEKKNDETTVVGTADAADSNVTQAHPVNVPAKVVEPQTVEPQRASSNAEPVEFTPVENTVAVETEITKPDTAVVQAAAPAVEPTATIEPEAVETSIAEADIASVRTTTRDDFFDKSMDEIIAERNAYLKEMDRAYLEDYRASQQRLLQLMRDRLARQEQRIKEMEQRYQEIYDIRAANLRETQEWRDRFLSDRI